MNALNPYVPGKGIVPLSPQIELTQKTAGHFANILKTQEEKIEKFTTIKAKCEKQFIDVKRNQELLKHSQNADLQSTRDKITILQDKISSLSNRINQLDIYEKGFHAISAILEKNTNPSNFLQQVALEEKKVLAHQIIFEIKEIIKQACKKRVGDQEFFYYMQGSINTHTSLLNTAISTKTYAEIIEFRDIIVNQIHVQINDYDNAKAEIEKNSLENIVKQYNGPIELPFSNEIAEELLKKLNK